MYPVVIAFYCDAGDTGIFQRLQGFNGAGECTGEDLASVEQVTCDQDEINLFRNGVSNDAAERAKEVFVSLGFVGSVAVCFAEMDVSGMEKFNSHGDYNISLSLGACRSSVCEI